jgi:hypothetical protein
MSLTSYRARNLTNQSVGQSASRLGPSERPALNFRFSEFSLDAGRKSLLYPRPSTSQRGVSRIVTDAGLDAMDAGGASDEGARSRMAKACGPDTSVLVSSSREVIPADDGGKKADHRGDHVITHKPSRAGMPG